MTTRIKLLEFSLDHLDRNTDKLMKKVTADIMSLIWFLNNLNVDITWLISLLDFEERETTNELSLTLKYKNGNNITITVNPLKLDTVIETILYNPLIPFIPHKFHRYQAQFRRYWVKRGRVEHRIYKIWISETKKVVDKIFYKDLSDIIMNYL